MHRILPSEGLISDDDVVTPEPVSWQDLGLVRGTDFLFRLRHGLLGSQADRRIACRKKPTRHAIVSHVVTEVALLLHEQVYLKRIYKGIDG